MYLLVHIFSGLGREMSDMSNGREKKIKIYFLTLRNLLIANFERQRIPRVLESIGLGWGLRI